MDNQVIIRDMLAGEEKQLKSIAMRCFPGLEGFGISTPKMAVIATVDGNVAGGVFLKVFEGRKGQKAGYLDCGFTVKAYRGMGVGKLTYKAAIDKLNSEGCDTVTALVKDDNAASWGLLKRNGFNAAGLRQFFRAFGFTGGIRVWINTMYCIACGMNLWMNRPAKTHSGAKEMALFFFANLLCVLPWLGISFVRQGGDVMWSIPAYLLVMALSVIAGLIGCGIGGGRYYFGFNRGGILITLLVASMGSFFPMTGRWYPREYENTATQKRSLGIQALCEWAVILLSCMAFLYLLPEHAFKSYLITYMAASLIFRILAIYPLESFGGGRVFRWSKAAYLVAAAITSACIWLPPI